MKLNSRRIFFRKAGLGLAAFSLRKVTALTVEENNGNSKDEVFFTTGFKTAEVTPNSAILWTRLCQQAVPNPVKHARLEKVFRHPVDFDETMPVAQMDGAVAGSGGWVRVLLKDKASTLRSGWHKAEASEDFTVKIPFKNLKPATEYQMVWEAKASEKGAVFTQSGTFTTAPDEETERPIQLVTSTCQYFWSHDDAERGFKTYDSMARMNPDFFLQTGDYVYYDKPGPLAKTLEKARHKWHAMDSWPALRDFYQKTPAYLLKDDHDLLDDDSGPTSPAYGNLTFADGLKVWHENVPLADKPYRTFRWGKDLQIWLAEGREFRSPNKSADNPGKTIWGEEQKKWFQETVEASDATFKILFSPTPIVGPDREKKTDNHANDAFRTEGDWLRKYLTAQKNMYVVNGDRHWQYVSVDDETGLMEFGSGPVSDAHVQGWDEGDVRPEHRYLSLIGGFLGVKIMRENGSPIITFTHYNVDGQAVHHEKLVAV
ncbi:alkaline phosphatase D family protein [Persicitalea jodogahamensis]|uniref:Alkaline phosphatase n=1 Tax=Persicitalea jodogahamensis TaxID=402147 RepID=A0A8J3GAZ1_9BACT|nr:alkaline phosphatase D family protein [Persicitalea jodogahamensis]GHB73391.1 alkaline phosphatase [Persicitalea jodogahamensis]